MGSHSYDFPKETVEICQTRFLWARKGADPVNYKIKKKKKLNITFTLQAKVMNQMKEQETVMVQMKVELDRLKSSDEEAKVSSNKITTMEDELNQLRAELERVTKQRDKAVKDKEELMKENEVVSDLPSLLPCMLAAGLVM